MQTETPTPTPGWTVDMPLEAGGTVTLQRTTDGKVILDGCEMTTDEARQLALGLLDASD